jgi:hypothetical protein
MHEHDESDSCVVPEKQANNVERTTAESVEGRRLAKGKPACPCTSVRSCSELTSLES